MDRSHQQLLSPTSSSSVYNTNNPAASAPSNYPAVQHMLNGPSTFSNGGGVKRAYEGEGGGGVEDYNNYRPLTNVNVNGQRADETSSRDVSQARDSSTASPGGPNRKKQKRNKPTLSCYECVERKTKARTGFPYVSLLDTRWNCLCNNPFMGRTRGSWSQVYRFLQLLPSLMPG